jgi:tetratricopeptide (TPR) repeat protein
MALTVWGVTPDATILRIQNEISAGKLEAADAGIKAAFKLNPNDGGLYNLRGIVHANRHEMKEAAADFTQAIHFSPHLVGAYLNLGHACETLGDLDPAIEQDRRLLKTDPSASIVKEQLAGLIQQRAAALLDLARTAQQQKDFQGALSYLAHARDLTPDAAPVHFFFGIVCIELDLPVEAKKSLQKALDLDPANPTYNYARGSVELQGRSAWQAIPFFQKFVAASPNDPRGHFALGVAEFSSQDYESAEKEMNFAAAARETAAGAEYFLGRIAKAAGDWPSSAAHLQKSIDVDPTYADSHAELGLARMHLDDLAGARKEIDQALVLNPESYIANGNLLTLLRRTRDPAVPSQEQRLRDLDSKRSEKQELMLRTVEVTRYAN